VDYRHLNLFPFKHIKGLSTEHIKRLIDSDIPVIGEKGCLGVDDPSCSAPCKYFLDFGTHLGGGLEKIKRREKLNEDVEIHSFEANPHAFQQIKFQDDINYHNIAISEINGFVNFNCEIDDDGKPYGGGSSLIDLAYWNPERSYGWKANERYSRYKSCSVFSLSIIPLLDLLLPKKTEKSILAKFDVEGAEFGIFKQLRDTDNFKWFSKIYVEFHEHIIKGLDSNTGAIDWLLYFEQIGLDTVLWD
jgi:FkbM family methyltransferase